jgi:cobalt-zinc-cadmium efflux system protein
LAITSVFCVAEVLGGLWTHSLALIADAGHMLTDVGSLALALVAARFAARPATPGKTFGYYRAEILAALVNGVTLVFVALYIFYESFRRFQGPPEIDVIPMVVIAVGGLIANLVTAHVLSGSRDQSLNVRGAFLHVLGDILGSLGAIAAGVVMYATKWYLADPIISIVIGILVLVSSRRLLLEAINVLMEGVPAHLDVEAIEAAMKKVSGVVQVHDLHVWTVTSGFDALSAHALVQNGLSRAQTQALLSQLHEAVHGFGVEHTTFQLEEARLFQIRTQDRPA